MTSNRAITEALLSLRSGGRISDAWWTDDAIAQAINIIKGLNVTQKQLNIAVSKDGNTFCDVDTVAGLDSMGGTMRIKRKVNNVVRYFYYLKMNKDMQIPRNQHKWRQIVTKDLPRLSPRHTAIASSRLDDSGETAMVDFSSPSQNEYPRPQKRNRLNFDSDYESVDANSIPIVSPLYFNMEVGIWHDAKTRNLFGVHDNNHDVRDVLEKTINTITEALTNGDLSSVLTLPHRSMAEESLPGSVLLHICSKIRILRLAYIVALDYYDEGWTWKDCCAYAMTVLSKCGERTYATRTVMKWHRRFRQTKTWPHPFESSRQYKPWFFRNHPAAEQIARRHLCKDLASLSVETATEYFRSTFIDNVIDME